MQTRGAVLTSPVLRGQRIAVVVPAYNEARWIAETVRGMPSYVDDVVVVDDASTDGTAELARAASACVTLVRHAENAGVGAAIASGYRRARGLGAAVVAVMAGDGQMHPDDLGPLVEPVLCGELDYAKGDRTAHPDARRIMPIVRYAGTIALGSLTRLAAGLPSLRDSQCGFTAISAHAIDRLDLDALWPSFGYPNDLVGALARAGLRVGDVPVRPVYRGEASGLRPWHAITIGFVVARVAVRRWVASSRGAVVPARPAPSVAPAVRPVAAPEATLSL